MEAKDRLTAAREAAGYKSPAEASRAIKSINQHTLTSNENGNRELSRKMAKVYAEAFGVDAGWLLYGRSSSETTKTVQLVGKIGAGAEIDLLNSDDFNEMVEAPANAVAETIAVEVSGDSMFPAYEEGTLLYYSQNLPPHELINSRCVIKLTDGRIFVKTLRAGADGFWNLESLNPSTPTMTDKAVEWVAKIDWVKPR